MGIGKILIADPKRFDRETLAKRLEAEGYEVVQATDGSETVSAVRCHRPNILLLSTSFPPDVSHGGGALTDGFLVFDWLKRMEEAVGLLVILVTEENAQNLQTRARAAGAVGLFQKPVNHDTLVGVLQRFLRNLAPAA